MIGYFPALYPDELLYSAIARFGVHTALSSPAVHQALFGRHVQHPSLAFPSHLAELGRRTGLDPDGLINHHTNLPYLTAFMDRPRARTLSAAMKVKPVALKAVHVAVTASASLIPPMNTLRFCVECAREDLVEYGEAYWHRLHQLHLVVVCPRHGCVLRTTPPLSGAARNRLHPAMPQSMSDANTYPVIDRVDREDVEHLIRLAEDCAALTRGEMPNGMSRNHFSARLRAGFVSKGFHLGKVGINWKDVRARSAEAWMARYWPDMFPASAKKGGWLSRVVTSRDHSRTENVQLAFEVLRVLPTHDLAFGQGPWSCTNPMAEHFGQPVVVNVKRAHHRGMTVGHFSCECGSVFTRQRDWSGFETQPRHSRFGPLLRGFIENAADQGWSLVRTATELGVDPGTLKRAIEVEGVNVTLRQRRSPTKRPTKERPAKRTGDLAIGDSAD